MDETRTLGRTDLRVKRIGFGANAVGGHNLFPNLNDETGKNSSAQRWTAASILLIRRLYTVWGVPKS